MCELERLVHALNGLRVPAQPEEAEIHLEIAAALQAAGIGFVHEAPLAPGCRIDFLCGRIGIEVKKGAPVRSRLLRQLERYAKSPLIDEIVVITQRSLMLPARIAGKRVQLIALNRLWGVSLP